MATSGALQIEVGPIDAPGVLNVGTVEKGSHKPNRPGVPTRGAEGFAAEDKAYSRKAKALNGLQSYVRSVKSQVSDDAEGLDGEPNCDKRAIRSQKRIPNFSLPKISFGRKKPSSPQKSDSAANLDPLSAADSLAISAEGGDLPDGSSVTSEPDTTLADLSIEGPSRIIPPVSSATTSSRTSRSRKTRLLNFSMPKITLRHNKPSCPQKSDNAANLDPRSTAESPAISAEGALADERSITSEPDTTLADLSIEEPSRTRRALESHRIPGNSSVPEIVRRKKPSCPQESDNAANLDPLSTADSLANSADGELADESSITPEPDTTLVDVSIGEPSPPVPSATSSETRPKNIQVHAVPRSAVKEVPRSTGDVSSSVPSLEIGSTRDLMSIGLDFNKTIGLLLCKTCKRAVNPDARFIRRHRSHCGSKYPLKDVEKGLAAAMKLTPEPLGLDEFAERYPLRSEEPITAVAGIDIIDAYHCRLTGQTAPLLDSLHALAQKNGFGETYRNASYRCKGQRIFAGDQRVWMVTPPPLPPPTSALEHFDQYLSKMIDTEGADLWTNINTVKASRVTLGDRTPFQQEIGW
ncbi:hypothetical protein FRC01_006354, partial [Tulasnella sp. 417]